MKSKCSFILKASTALVLALLMLFGTVATSIAAVVDNADTGANIDLAETGWSDVYLIGDMFGDWSTGKLLGNGNFSSAGMYYFNNGDYFAVKISGTQYGPSTNNSNFVVSGCRADTSGNAFKFNGTSGWYKVGVDQVTGDNDKKPWLWLVSQTAPTRTVAGDTGLTGYNWNTSQNAMTFDTSIDKFKWTSSAVSTVGDYSFKVTDGSWNNSWPSSNYDVKNVPAGARVVVICDYYDDNAVNAYIEYKITVASATGGSATTSPSGFAKSGTEVTITSSPSTGYNAGTPTVKDSDNSSVTVSSNKFTMPSKNVTVTPNFTLKTYTVSYNKGSNGAGTNTTDTKTHGTNFTLKDKLFTRTGYTQTAWNTNSSGTGGTSYALKGTYSTNAAVTLYPTWTANQTTLSFDRNGATTNGTQTVSGRLPTTPICRRSLLTLRHQRPVIHLMVGIQLHPAAQSIITLTVPALHSGKLMLLPPPSTLNGQRSKPARPLRHIPTVLNPVPEVPSRSVLPAQPAQPRRPATASVSIPPAPRSLKRRLQPAMNSRDGSSTAHTSSTPLTVQPIPLLQAQQRLTVLLLIQRFI